MRQMTAFRPFLADFGRPATRQADPGEAHAAPVRAKAGAGAALRSGPAYAPRVEVPR
jgi:hypothetical protein